MLKCGAELASAHVIRHCKRSILSAATTGSISTIGLPSREIASSLRIPREAHNGRGRISFTPRFLRGSDTLGGIE